MQTHRAYLDAATTVTCWARDEAGGQDLSAAVLRAYLYPYGCPVEVESGGISATGNADGRIQFTVSVVYGDASLSPGSYRLSIRNSSDAQVYGGLLEVV